MLCTVPSVRFRRAREINRGFREREFAFRAPQALVGLAGVECHAQRAWVGEPDVLDRHSHHATADVQWVSAPVEDRKSTRLNSSHTVISYAVFCLKKKKRREMSAP